MKKIILILLILSLVALTYGDLMPSLSVDSQLPQAVKERVDAEYREIKWEGKETNGVDTFCLDDDCQLATLFNDYERESEYCVQYETFINKTQGPCILYANTPREEFVDEKRREKADSIMLARYNQFDDIAPSPQVNDGGEVSINLG